MHNVPLIPGDGIGPEVSAAARRAVDATGVKIDWELAELNPEIMLKTGQSLPQHVVDSLERTCIGLKGPVTTPIAGGYTSVNVPCASVWTCTPTCGRCAPFPALSAASAT